MCKHDAEYFRRRCRALRVPEHDPFSASKFVKRGFELQRLEQLSWPKNMFGDYASISELMAEAAELSGRGADNTDSVCPCGCRSGGCKGECGERHDRLGQHQPEWVRGRPLCRVRLTSSACPRHAAAHLPRCEAR